MFQVPGIYILPILGTVGWISGEMFGEIRREYCHWSEQIQKYRHCNVLGKDEQAPFDQYHFIRKMEKQSLLRQYQIQVSSLELVKIMSLPRN